MASTTDTTEGILKQDSLGRVRTLRKRREVLLEEYERSGMSGREFATFSGVKYQTFATWVQKRSKARSDPKVGAGMPPVQWMEAVLGEEAGDPGKRVLVVEVPGGVRMEVRDMAGAKLAAEVLRHLGGAKAC